MEPTEHKQVIEKERLIKIINELLASAMVSENYRKIHKFYCDRLNNNTKLFSIAPGYFQYTDRALRHGVMTELMRMYDKDTKSISIDRLCNICIQCDAYFSKEVHCLDGKTRKFCVKTSIKEYKEAMKPLRKSLDNLWMQRKTIWAHKDLDYATHSTSVEIEYPLSWEEIETVLQIAIQLLTKLSSGINGCESSFEFYDGNDVEKLFLHFTN